jgi:hypothetical protein
MAIDGRQMTLAAGDHRSAIARLAGELHVPPPQVEAIYRVQLDRLAETARIPRYLGLLAAKRTRGMLRSSKPAPREENRS